VQPRQTLGKERKKERKKRKREEDTPLFLTKPNKKADIYYKHITVGSSSSKSK